MDLSDLLVSYNQVQMPEFYRELDITPTTVSLDLDRVKSLDLPEDTPIKFTGWNFPQKEEENIENNSPSSNNIVQFFMDKGLTKNQAKGIYGNLMQESGGRLKALSKDGYDSYGLAQWTGKRKLRLISKYGQHPTKQQQLEFIWEELNTTEKHALKDLLKTNTVAEATESFMKKYERPSSKYANLQARLKYAHSIV